MGQVANAQAVHNGVEKVEDGSFENVVAGLRLMELETGRISIFSFVVMRL